VGHGNYAESVLAALWHTRAEGTYNVLQYALLIYHWECYTLKGDVRREIARYYRSLQAGSSASRN
jgi:hypothetical protein